MVWDVITIAIMSNMDADLEIRRDHIHAAELLAAALKSLDKTNSLRHWVTMMEFIAARLHLGFHF